MDLKSLKTQIKQNNLDNLYLFTGTEIKIKRIFIEQISNITKLPVTHLDNVISYYNKRLKTKTLVKTRGIYVINNDMDYIKQDISVWNTLVENVKKTGDILIFIYTNLDKRAKFYKFFENYIVEFVNLSKTVLSNYLKKDFALPTTIATTIVENSANDYTYCCMEAHKLVCYQKALNIETTQAVSQLTQAGVLSKNANYDVLQKFMESFLICDWEQCLHYHQLIDYKINPPLKIIAYLYNSFKALFSVVAYEYGMSYKKNESVSNFWAVKTVEIFSPQWRIQHVRQVIQYLQKLEMGIKTGTLFINTDNIIQELVVNCHFIRCKED